MSKQIPSLGRIVHVAEAAFSAEDGVPRTLWRAAIIIDCEPGAEEFGVAVLTPREQRYDVYLDVAEEGMSWRWPPFVAPKAD